VSEDRLTPGKIRDENLNASPDTKEELLNSMITPQNGRAPIGNDLRSFYKVQHNDINKSGWDMFSAVTSDTRLSKLNEAEKRYVTWCLKVQGMCIYMDMSKPAIFSDWLRLCICEPSLATDGFLRTNLQSVHTKNETISTEEKPPKRNLFGFIKGE